MRRIHKTGVALILMTSILCHMPDVTISSAIDNDYTAPVPTLLPEDTTQTDGLSDDERAYGEAFEKIKAPTPKILCHTAKKVKLKWKKVSQATSYEIYRKSSGAKKYKKIAATHNTHYKDKSTKKRKTYRYRLVAVMNIKDTVFKSIRSKSKKTYVMPSKAKTVILGECFVEDFVYQKNKFPRNVKFVPKIGLNTYTMLHGNYFTYRGATVTAVEKAATYHPDRIYFLIGANEAKNGRPGAATKNFARARKLFKKINKHVEIVLIALPPFGWHSTQNIPTPAKRRAFNKRYKKYAKKHKDVYYCDATKGLGDSTSHLMKKYDGGDGCHWNSAGTSVVIKALKKWSKKKFGSF